MSRRLLILVNDAGFFLSHRLPLARAAVAAGWEVAVATRPDERSPEIAAAGLAFHPVPIRRFGLKPAGELRTALAVAALCRRLRPDLLHCVTLKAAVPGLLAARLAGVPAAVLAITGSGRTYSDGGLVWRLLQRAIPRYLSLLAGPRTRLLVQNPEDGRALAPRGALAERTVLIRGSGVDLAAFAATPEPPEPMTVLLASRLIAKKGIAVYVEAARRARSERPDLRFLLAGAPDPGNPDAVPEATLRGWHEAGTVEWLGRRDDMARLMADCHVVCLPSQYGEGVPKCLIEGAAAGRALVATDVAGCREVCRDGETGLLVPPGDAGALAAAFLKLAAEPDLRRRLGARARAVAEAEFDVASVNRRTLELYDSLLD
ncbi:MAG: glycosyltransferase family 4 protein [Tistlia sp.]|uniref:glycosyltransferase family 4 protein n=1 Tax=Tistlia sp. TaxID=3057121 RepID=UPI0034A1C35B